MYPVEIVYRYLHWRGAVSDESHEHRCKKAFFEKWTEVGKTSFILIMVSSALSISSIFVFSQLITHLNFLFLAFICGHYYSSKPLSMKFIAKIAKQRKPNLAGFGGQKYGEGAEIVVKGLWFYGFCLLLLVNSVCYYTSF